MSQRVYRLTCGCLYQGSRGLPEGRMVSCPSRHRKGAPVKIAGPGVSLEEYNDPDYVPKRKQPKKKLGEGMPRVPRELTRGMLTPT